MITRENSNAVLYVRVLAAGARNSIPSIRCHDQTLGRCQTTSSRMFLRLANLRRPEQTMIVRSSSHIHQETSATQEAEIQNCCGGASSGLRQHLCITSNVYSVYRQPHRNYRAGSFITLTLLWPSIFFFILTEFP